MQNTRPLTNRCVTTLTKQNKIHPHYPCKPHAVKLIVCIQAQNMPHNLNVKLAAISQTLALRKYYKKSLFKNGKQTETLLKASIDEDAHCWCNKMYFLLERWSLRAEDIHWD